jgi:hypothetical protein
MHACMCVVSLSTQKAVSESQVSARRAAAARLFPQRKPDHTQYRLQAFIAGVHGCWKGVVDAAVTKTLNHPHFVLPPSACMTHVMLSDLLGNCYKDYQNHQACTAPSLPTNCAAALFTTTAVSSDSTTCTHHITAHHHQIHTHIHSNLKLHHPRHTNIARWWLITTTSKRLL